jgi:hypothetical protein
MATTAALATPGGYLMMVKAERRGGENRPSLRPARDDGEMK